MNPTDIAWHLENLGDTWKGWGKVLQSLAELFSQAWRDALKALIEQFDPETGLLNPANKDELKEVLKTPATPNAEGEYEFDGLSSAKGSSTKQ